MKAEIFNHQDWITETDPTILFQTFQELLTTCGYTIINCTDHHFSPQGYTCLWLLAESHFALHTFPEAHKTYIELSGCNEAMNDLFAQKLEAWKHQTQMA